MRGAGSQSSAPVVALGGWGDIRALWFTSPSAENENIIISGLISEPYHTVLSNIYVYKSSPLIFLKIGGCGESFLGAVLPQRTW